VIDNSGTVVWRAEYEPFGNVFQFRTQVTSQILRLPGQDLMLTENLAEDHYNLFRWYRTEWGRYTQADPLFRSPIGQPYSYAGGNPLVFIDPFGLYHTGDVIYRCDPATHTHCDVVTVLSDPTPDDNNNGDELVIAYGDKFGCKSGQCGDGAHITALRGPDDPYPDYEVLGVCEQLATYGEIADRWADWIINKNDPPWTPLGAGQFSQCYHFVDQLTNQGTTGLELQSNYPFVVVVPHDLTWWKKKCKGKL
jgi:RHS repeat-associated protein